MIAQVNTSVIHERDAITRVETPKERLRRLRKEAGLSQPALAKLAGVSQGTIGNIESGLRGYGESIVSIAAALKVSAEYLRCDPGAPKARPLVPPPPPPNGRFEDRHEISDSDFALLQAVHMTMSDDEKKTMLKKAEHALKVALEQIGGIGGKPR